MEPKILEKYEALPASLKAEVLHYIEFLTEKYATQNIVENALAVLYTQLEEHLQNQRWYEADRETYLLMITIVGKEEGQWFSVKDFKNFPCDDLKTIDQLWLHHSNGKWGFSVQEKIWQECGSPRTYNTLEWFKFGERVGWYKKDNDRWLLYSHLTCDLQKSPPGELPFLHGFCGMDMGTFEDFEWGMPDGRSDLQGDWGTWGGLFSCVEACRL